MTVISMLQTTATAVVMITATPSPLAGAFGVSGGANGGNGNGFVGNGFGGGGATTRGTETPCWTVGAVMAVTLTPRVLDSAELSVEARAVAAAVISAVAAALPDTLSGMVRIAFTCTLPGETRSSRKHAGS